MYMDSTGVCECMAFKSMKCMADTHPHTHTYIYIYTHTASNILKQTWVHTSHLCICVEAVMLSMAPALCALVCMDMICVYTYIYICTHTLFSYRFVCTCSFCSSWGVKELCKHTCPHMLFIIYSHTHTHIYIYIYTHILV